MSSQKIKNIKHGAIVLANDLRTGLTSYLCEDGSWSDNLHAAWVVTNDADADQAKLLAANATDANDVTGAYLVDTTVDGLPTHIREHLRTTGPSVAYLSTAFR